MSTRDIEQVAFLKVIGGFWLLFLEKLIRLSGPQNKHIFVNALLLTLWKKIYLYMEVLSKHKCMYKRELK